MPRVRAPARLQQGLRFQKRLRVQKRLRAFRLRRGLALGVPDGRRGRPGLAHRGLALADLARGEAHRSGHLHGYPRDRLRVDRHPGRAAGRSDRSAAPARAAGRGCAAKSRARPRWSGGRRPPAGPAMPASRCRSVGCGSHRLHGHPPSGCPAPVRLRGEHPGPPLLRGGRENVRPPSPDHVQA